MNFTKKPIFLSLLSATLLTMPWIGLGSFWIWGAFVPLLSLQQNLRDEGRKGFLWWVALTLVIWILASCFWVSFAFWGSAIAIPLVGLVSLWPAWWIYNVVWRRSPKALAYTVLVAGWIAAEWWYSMGDVSFPWLTLGGAFASSPAMVQWYSLTGIYGGTLWIMVANILIYTTLKKRRVFAWAISWIAVPIIVSLVIYGTYTEPTEKIQVAVVQPNIDPYGEKYSTNGLDVILPLVATAPATTELFVAPETAISNLDLRDIKSNDDILRIQEFLRSRGNGAVFVIGASAYDENLRYNSSLYVDTIGVQIYNKSKLVMGVEVVPEWLSPVLDPIDLGGYVGSLGRQELRSVFKGPVAMGSAVCYESIYGEYFSQWAVGGARIMTIVTNDGWWRDTPGHVHHSNYARLRAIENRRSVARSANTGISALIDPTGAVVEKLGWDERGIVTGVLPLNSTVTPYMRWGDITARLSLYTLALALLYFIGNFYRKKV